MVAWILAICFWFLCSYWQEKWGIKIKTGGLFFFAFAAPKATPYGRRKTKTKNQNIRALEFVCVDHKERPYNVGKNGNRNLQFLFL